MSSSSSFFKLDRDIDRSKGPSNLGAEPTKTSGPMTHHTVKSSSSTGEYYAPNTGHQVDPENNSATRVKYVVEKPAPPSPPPFFQNFSKPIHDFMNRGFTTSQHMVSVSKITPVGVNLTTTATKVDDIFVGLVSAIGKFGNVSAEVSTGTLGTIQAELALENAAPGFTPKLRGVFPQPKSGQAVLQYQHAHAALQSIVGLHARPHADVSAAFGGFSRLPDLSLGGDVGYDFETQQITKANAGWHISSGDTTTSAVMGLTAQSTGLDVSMLHSISPAMSQAVQVNHSFGKSPNLITYALSYKLDSKSTLKGKFNSSGTTSLLLEHEFQPLSTVSIAAELDARNFEKTMPKVGVSINIMQ
eukprot:jgi/Mesen1/1188/ME000127S00219